METAGPTTTSVESEIPSFPVGLSEHRIEIGSVTRRYLVYFPDTVSDPIAAVVVLHGGGGRGLDVATEYAQPLSVFRNVADREGFVVVYPEGLPSNDRRELIGWVDCRSDNLVASDADDLGFLTTLVETLRNRLDLSTSQMFMTGSSNGALMSQAFAFHRPESIGAIAVSAGNLPERPRQGACSQGPSRPIPILLAHGTADTQMPFAGGCVADLAGVCNRGRVVSAEATVDRWLSINGLTEVTPVASVVDLDEADAGPAHRFVYDGEAPVEWWRLDGAGHTSPSRLVAIDPTRFAGAQNRDVEFAEIAWAFFAERMGAT